MSEIICALGGEAERLDGVWQIRATEVSGHVPDRLARRMRASIVLLGALLARAREAHLARPGGDEIGSRRVEPHLRGLRALGAEIEETDDAFHATAPNGLRGARVLLDLPTVTGTENLMLAAVTAMGRTEIINAAREPHVQDLALCLNQMGGRISGAGSDEILIDGVSELDGCEHEVISDYLEAGTYAMAVGAAGGDVTLERSRPQDLAHALLKLEQAGVEVETGPGLIRIRRDRHKPLRPVDLNTWVHPGFPTDLQPQYLSLMTQACGTTLISEYLYDNRFQQVPELVRMGADIRVSGHDAVLRGPSRLRGTTVRSPDIRAAAALVVAALAAEGTTEIERAWHLDRGYEDMVGKLRSLGARVERAPHVS
jgi:UDP-N-acetylglucosamine 1-carboxyvinyltransferase